MCTGIGMVVITIPPTVVDGIGVATVGLCVVTAAAAARHRTRPGATEFSLTALAVGGLAAVVAAWRFDVLSPTVASAAVTVGLVLTPLVWAAFVFAYTGRGPALTRGWVAVLAGLGAVTVGSTALAAAIELTAPGIGGQAVLTVTVLSQVAVFSLSLLGVLLVGRAALTYDDLPPGRAAALIVAGLGVTLLPFWWLLAGTISTPTILSLTTAQLVATGGALFLGQFGTGLFTDRPLTGHLARETILDTMSESVIIADQNDRILDANEQAVETFGIERSQLPNRRTTDIGIAPAADDVVVLDTEHGAREFRVSRTPLSAPRGSPVGYAYRLRDVTDEHTQEQKLEVFNRILRHNLRNDLDAIRGFAEAIRADGGEPGHADRVVDISGELVELTAQLETANEILTNHTPTAEACDLVAVAKAAAETARARVDAGTGAVTVTVAANADKPVRVDTDPRILRFALAELITNGLEHSARPSPEVELRLEDRPDGVTVAVCDDGPGLPANERAVLVAGEETPLRHGRGIGLWTVRWAVKRLGGELSVADRDPTGTVVTVVVPDNRDS